VLALGVLLLASPLLAQDARLPLKLQVTLFKKVFAYDAQLTTAAPLKILVVHAPGYRRDADDILRMFTTEGLLAEAVLESEIQERSQGASVLYVLPRAAHAGIAERSAQSKLLSISGVPRFAEAGYVSVALAVRADGRPEIIVNLAMSSPPACSGSRG
jgi:hypothetical protein